jgi:hypothetical protein
MRYAVSTTYSGWTAQPGGDEVFPGLGAGLIIEPTSKQDSLRVLPEAGAEPVSYRTVTRRPTA